MGCCFFLKFPIPTVLHKGNFDSFLYIASEEEHTYRLEKRSELNFWMDLYKCIWDNTETQSLIFKSQ